MSHRTSHDQSSDGAAELIRLCVDGSPSASDIAALRSVLRECPEARDLYVDYLRLHAMLEFPNTARTTTPQAGGGSPPPAHPARPAPPTRFEIPNSYVYATAALVAIATVLVGVYAYVSFVPQSELPDPTSTAPLANLIENASGGTLITPGGFISEGRDYPRGEYALDKGSAEFMLTNSVNVKLRGETRMVMRNDMNVSLTRGSAEFVVPKDATGFTVHLPDGSKIIDLGTAFNVMNHGDGQATITVTEGRIRIDHITGLSQEFAAGKRIALSSASLTPSDVSLATTITPEMGLRVLDYSSQLADISKWDRKAAYLIDGSGLTGETHSNEREGTTWNSQGNYLGTGNDPLPAHITFDLGDRYDIEGLHIWNCNFEGSYGRHPFVAMGAQHVEVWVSTTDRVEDLIKLDTSLGHFVFPMATGRSDYTGFDLEFSHVTNSQALRSVRLVRLVILSHHADVGGQGLVGLSEVRFAGSPTDIPSGELPEPTPTPNTAPPTNPETDHRDRSQE